MICKEGEGPTLYHWPEVADRVEGPEQFPIIGWPELLSIIEFLTIKTQRLPSFRSPLFEDAAYSKLACVGGEGEVGAGAWMMKKCGARQSFFCGLK